MTLKIELHAQDISDIFWRNLALRHQAAIRNWLRTLDTEGLVAEDLRAKADYNTGSIPTATAVALLILGMETKPETTFEVGTFIGNSTRALALSSRHVYTCDGSNDLPLGLPNVTQYPKTMSTTALEQFKATGKKIDLLFLDGRLQPADLPLVAELLNSGGIIALDDCYQLEKGMVNVSLFQGKFYLPPPRGEPFAAFGVPGGTTLGLVVPPAALQILQG